MIQQVRPVARKCTKTRTIIHVGFVHCAGMDIREAYEVLHVGAAQICIGALYCGKICIGVRYQTIARHDRFVAACLMWLDPNPNDDMISGRVTEGVRASSGHRYVQTLQRPQEPSNVQQYSGVSFFHIPSCRVAAKLGFR